jgi:hypothetical protein
MSLLWLGLAGLAAFLYFTRGKPVLKRREWRVVSASVALAAVTAGAYLAVRGKWGIAIGLILAGLLLAASARKTVATPSAASPGRMSDAEARRILGVGPEATKSDIQAAYARLMRSVHPDAGGTAGLAAQLNAARDRLLKG